MAKAPAGTAGNPTPAGLIRRNFFGAVVLKAYAQDYDGNQHIAYVGEISVLSAMEALGFDVNSNDSNWCVRATGKYTQITIPGCQVRMVIALPENAAVTNSDYWRVP
jgi:hypothetical protein